MHRTVVIIAALGLALTATLIPVSGTLAGEISFETLVKHPNAVEPEQLAELGLKHDRAWVLNTLIGDIIASPDRSRRLSALMQIEEHGDPRWLDALTDAIPKIDRPSLATAARHVATRLRGKLISSPVTAAQYWTNFLKSQDPIEILDAVSALGDIGDRQIIPRLLELGLKVRSEQSTADQDLDEPKETQRQLPAGLDQEIQLALAKINLLSKGNPVDAYYSAAVGEPRPELRNRNGVCRLKIWGLRGLSKLKSAESRQKLFSILEQHDARLRHLITTTKGDKRLAHQLFALDQSDAYAEEALKCATRSGQDVSATGKLRVVREVFRVP